MAATIIPLIICHTCQTKLKNKGDEWIFWEGSIYCSSCFENYLRMIEDEVFKD